MSAKVGHVSFNVMYGRKDRPVFDKPYSDTLARVIDEEVRTIIEEVRARAYRLLESKRDKQEELAQLLLEQEVLGPADLVRVLGERPYGDYVSLNGTPANKEEAVSEDVVSSPTGQVGESEGSDKARASDPVAPASSSEPG